MDTQTLLIVFVGLTGAAVLLQACVLLGIFIALRKTAKSVTEVTDDLKATIIPLVHTSRNLMERISPQVLTISSGLAELTELVHKQSGDVKVSVSEIMERISRQTARLDAMLTVGLDNVERAAATLETSVAAPVRQANGIIAAIKATIETYRTWPRPRPASVSPVQPVYPDPDRDVIS